MAVKYRLLLLLCFPVLLTAQSSTGKRLIYRMTTAQAERLLLEEPDPLLRQLLTAPPVDSFPPFAGVEVERNGTGHYLVVGARGEVLEATYRHVTDLQLVELPTERGVAFRLLDERGMSVTNARATLGSTRIPYDPMTESYRRAKDPKGDFLTVRTEHEMLFYRVETGKKTASVLEQRVRYWRRTPAGRWITLPVRAVYRLMRGVAGFVKRGLRGEWQLRNPFRGLLPQKNRKSWNGYLALSQPRYRPGDTLVLTAYLTDQRGRPLRESVQLSIREGGRQRRMVFEQRIEPDGQTPGAAPLTSPAPGRLVLRLPLADTLQLDLRYDVELRGEHGRRRTQFRLEDYQLDRTEFTLTTSQVEYTGTEAVALLATARDRNGNSLRDGELRYVIVTERPLDYHADYVFLPDTLHTDRLELNPAGATTLVLPDSIFPAASLRVGVRAVFRDGAGEQEQVRTSFTYRRPAGGLDLALREGNVVVRTTHNGTPTTERLLLARHRIGGGMETTSIMTPHREPLRPEVLRYAVRRAPNAHPVTLSPTRFQKQVMPVTARRWTDTVAFVVPNPYRLPVIYRIYRERRLLAEGTTDSTLVWTRRERGDDGYHLRLSYVLGGRSATQKAEIQHRKRQLDLTLDHVPVARPGEAVEVTVRARDYRGKPAAGVVLTSGAPSTIFEQKTFTTPRIRYRTPPAPLRDEKLTFSPKTDNPPPDTLTRRWFERLELADQDFYRLRFPTEGVFLEYEPAPDTTERYLAQVAPYVVENGRMEAVYLVYLNRQPVYHYLNQTDYPYSFAAPPGKHQLTIRTRTREIELKNVELRAGQKLTLVANRSAPRGPDWRQRYRERNVGTGLTRQELRSLENSTLVLRPHTPRFQWVQRDSTRIFRLPPRGGRILVGPVPRLSSLRLHRADTTFRLRFEPGFSYQLNTERDRLYEYNFAPHFQPDSLLPAHTFPPLGEFAHTRADLYRRPRPAFRLAQKPLPYSRSQPTSLRVEARVPGDHLILVHNGEPYLYPFRKDLRLLRVPPGDYAAYLLTDSTSHRREFVVRRYGKTYVEFRANHASPDSTGFHLLDSLRRAQFRALNAGEQLGEFQIRGDQSGVLVGTLTDVETSEPLLFANVIAFANGVQVGGTETNIDGQYGFETLPPGVDVIEFSYTGYQTLRVELTEEIRFGGRLDAQLYAGEVLETVMLTYAKPLVEQDNTSQGSIITSESITSLPVKNINAIAASTAGVAPSESGKQGTGTVYVDGVPVDSDLTANFLDLNNAAGSELRENFRDHAWFHPHAVTDRSGAATFRVRLPDDIAAYRPFAVGMDRRARAGAAESRLRAFKPVTAQLAIPRFLTAGDELSVRGRVANYTGDTLRVRTRFTLGNDPRPARDTVLALGMTEAFPLTAPAADSLTFTYELTRDNYRDGERRSIHLNPVGTDETRGSFRVLTTGDTERFVPDSKGGAVTVYATASMVPTLRQNLRWLRTYPYLCNEQLASRLRALLLEREVRLMLDENLVTDTLDLPLEIERALATLRERQHPDDRLWGWFDERRFDARMSPYVLRVLHEAERAGFDVDFREPALRSLTERLPVLPRRALLAALEVLALDGQRLDYAAYLDPLDTLDLSPFETFQSIWVRELVDLPYSLDSLAEFRAETLFGGVRYGAPERSWYRHGHRLTALAYRIYRRRGDDAMLRRIRRGLLATRTGPNPHERSGGWGSTFLTAEVVALLLPDLLRETQGKTTATLTVNGQTQRTFPLRQTLPPHSPVEVIHNGGPEVYWTAYQTCFNSVPEPVGEYFHIRSELRQSGRRVDSLDTSLPAKLTVRWTTKSASEYVLVEVPIPAGCSYGDRTRMRGSWRAYGPGREVYRQYFRDRVAIFYADMPAGEYKVDIALEPRFAGRFTLNPAVVSEMYFPTFFGRNGVGEVVAR